MSSRPASSHLEMNKSHMDGDLDLSLLDKLSVDDFMSLIRLRQEKNQTATWDATVTLAQQWKLLRSLLSSSTSLLSKQVDAADFEKLLDLAHSTLNAERIVVLKYDEKEAKLVVVASREQTIKGVKVDINQSSEGEVFRTGRRRRISDVRKDSVFISFMDGMKEMNLKKLSSVICAPISVDGKVVGIVEACNRQSTTVSSDLTPYKGPIDYVPFNQYDDMNLEFIAGIIGLIWSQQSSVVTTKESSSALVSSIPAGADYDSFLDWVINETYKHLEADRVSLFTYNDRTKKLECKISQDIKGMSISPDKGIVGTVFNTMQPMTIDDARSDTRHYTDIDKDMGYQTRTIICAPVLDQNGHPIGVIQALNKKNGQNFTNIDIKCLSDLCERTSSVLKQKICIENRPMSIPTTPSNPIDQGDMLTKSVVSIMEATSLRELTAKVEQMSTAWGNSEYAGIYLLSNLTGKLDLTALIRFTCNLDDVSLVSSPTIVNITSPAITPPTIKSFRKIFNRDAQCGIAPLSRANSRLNMDDTIPEIILSACRDGDIIEQKLAEDNSLPEIFLKDFPAVRRVLICPMNLKILLKENETAVLVLGRKSMVGSFGSSTKKNIDMLRQIVEKSARLLFHNLSSKDSQASVASTPTVLSHKHVLSAILNDIKDYVCLFNGRGYILGCNRSLVNLLDLNDASILSILSSVCGHFSNHVASPEYHYTSIFNKHNILSSDISTMLLLPRNNNSSCEDFVNVNEDEMIKRTNYEISPGLHVDYVIKSLLVDVDIDSRGTDNDIIAVVISPPQASSGGGMPANGDLLVRNGSMSNIIPPVQILPTIETIRQSISVLERSLGSDMDILNNLHHLSSVLDTITQLLSAQTTPRDMTARSPAIKATVSKFGSRFASSVKVIPTGSMSPNTKTSDAVAALQTPSDAVTVSSSKSHAKYHSRRQSLSSHTCISHLASTTASSVPSPTGTCNEILFINNPVDFSAMQIHPLIAEDFVAPSGLHTWEFNVLEYQGLHQLRNICGRLFQDMFDFEEISINSKVLGSYIYDVSNSYHANPFHNFHHATTTLHFASMLIRSLRKHTLLSKLQFFAVMLSALVHDVDHPGNTNLFEIHTQSRLALRYNDQSVLENHHCSVAFQIMREPRANVLGTLPPAYAAETRKIMISCILATDMSVHFQLVDEIKAKINNNCDFHDINDKLFLSKIILHASDLSNPVRPFHISTSWARNISEEFNRQVALETSLGLPVLGFMMTADEKSFCKNELGFASFVVAPMWRNLATLFPEFDHLVNQLDSNLTSWKGKIDDIDAKARAEALKKGEKVESKENSPLLSPTAH
jgi:GAF domain-containing protein/PAS domain-containing protein